MRDRSNFQHFTARGSWVSGCVIRSRCSSIASGRPCGHALSGNCRNAAGLGRRQRSLQRRATLAALGAKLGVFFVQHGRRYQSLIDRLKAESERQLQEGCQRFQLWWENWQKAEIQVAIADLVSSTPAAWHLLREGEDSIATHRNELVAAAPQGVKRTA